MKKTYYFLLPVAVLLLSNGCVLTGKRVIGNGQVTSETRSAGDFEDIIVAGSINVYLTQGPVQPARIEAESNILPYIEINKKGNDGVEVRFRHHVSIETHHDVNIYLTSPRVHHLSAQGSGTIKVQDTLRNDDDIKLNIAGSGNIELQMHAPEVKANIAGSGNIIVGGQTRDMDINIAGSGTFEGKNLKSEEAKVNIAGSGDAHVYASMQLNAKILGSGNVYYGGNPTVNTQQAGSGSVIKR